MRDGLVTNGGSTLMNKTLTLLGKWLAAVMLAASLAGAIAPAMAQEIPPEQLALARKYVDLTNKAGLYEAILVQTAAQTSKLFSQSNPDITDKIDATIGTVLETYKGKNDELFTQFARVYATTFTQQELQEMVDFYATPTGQKLATKALEINAGIGAVLKVYTYILETEFVTKVRAALKEQGIYV
jgi:hypothetical protein